MPNPDTTETTSVTADRIRWASTYLSLLVLIILAIPHLPQIHKWANDLTNNVWFHWLGGCAIGFGVAMLFFGGDDAQ